MKRKTWVFKNYIFPEKCLTLADVPEKDEKGEDIWYSAVPYGVGTIHDRACLSLVRNGEHRYVEQGGSDQGSLYKPHEMHVRGVVNRPGQNNTLPAISNMTADLKDVPPLKCVIAYSHVMWRTEDNKTWYMDEEGNVGYYGHCNGFKDCLLTDVVAEQIEVEFNHA